MEICELDIAAYRGKALKVQYTTSYVYEAVVSQDAACFGVMFQRTALPKPLSCGFDDVWGSEWLEQPKLYGWTDCRSFRNLHGELDAEIADHQSVYRASLSGKRLRYPFAGACQTAGNAA